MIKEGTDRIGLYPLIIVVKTVDYLDNVTVYKYPKNPTLSYPMLPP